MNVLIHYCLTIPVPQCIKWGRKMHKDACIAIIFLLDSYSGVPMGKCMMIGSSVHSYRYNHSYIMLKTFLVAYQGGTCLLGRLKILVFKRVENEVVFFKCEEMKNG